MLSIQDLQFSYKSGKESILVFDGLSLDFQSGLNVILGPNGAGKSTLLKCIFGILKAKGGILYDGVSLPDLAIDEAVKVMSYLPQVESNLSTLRVLEVVLLGRILQLGNRVKDEDLDIVMDTLELLNITTLAERRISALSGGQQKMVSIAQTLVRKPKLILMDEPTNFLDLQKQLELCQLLKEIVRHREIDIVLALHDLNLAARYADHIVALDHRGAVFSEGNPRAVITGEMLYSVYGVNAHIAYDEKDIPVISPIDSIRSVGIYQGA